MLFVPIQFEVGRGDTFDGVVVVPIGIDLLVLVFEALRNIEVSMGKSLHTVGLVVELADLLLDAT